MSLCEKGVAPWQKKNYLKSYSTIEATINSEANDLYDFLKELSESRSSRKSTIKRLEELCKSRESVALPYGSFETELMLPLSDIDITVVSENSTPARTRKTMLKLLRTSGMFSILSVITNSRCPLIRAVEIATGQKIDITFENSSYRETLDLIKYNAEKYPLFRPVVLLIKFFLKQRGINDASNGGLSSFAISLLTISMFQHENLKQNCLGNSLLCFFKLYGIDFDHISNGIDIRDGGKRVQIKEFIFDEKKMKGYFSSKERKNTSVPLIINPMDGDLNVSKGTTKFYIARQFFKAAYLKLIRIKIPGDGSILKHIFFTSSPDINKQLIDKKKSKKRDKRPEKRNYERRNKQEEELEQTPQKHSRKRSRQDESDSDDEHTKTKRARILNKSRG
ncbi:non-canonical poly(A) RNA polymerase [Acrasis kona]|uniref:Non-canonical poly(A) RNA polymerase n=1 Tax=Acrasis kona TaxID=1008807 RepID=A0AAW2Z2M8_9EUKA